MADAKPTIVRLRTQALKIGSYVSDRSDRYDNRYRVVRVEGTRTLCEYVGQRTSGRMQDSTRRDQGYRTTDNLIEE